MKWLWRRFRGEPAKFDEELREEMEFHRAMKQRDLEAGGVDSDEARYAVARAFGNTALAAEDARAQWSFRWLAEAAQDIRYGIRSMRQQPAFAVATILALTLGIGVNAIVFNVWNTLAWQRWAIRDAESTVELLAGRNGAKWDGVSWPVYRYLREHSKTTSAIVAFNGGATQISYGETAWQARLNLVSDNFLDVVGTGYAVGRGFSRVMNPREPPAEMVLGYDFWQRRFHGDPGIVGQWVEASGQKLQIVGVTRAGFSGPRPEARDAWLVMEWMNKLDSAVTWDHVDSCCISVMARLRDDATAEMVQAEVSTLSTQFLQSMGRKPIQIIVTPPTPLGNPTMRSRTAMGFTAIGIASLLILLLACANVGNLQIARSLARGREIATRLSLGASRGRILRQMLTENLLLSLVAGAVSLWIASYLPLQIIRQMAPETLSLTFRNDWRVALFVVLLVIVTAPLIGLLPALGAVRGAVASGLRGEDSHVTARTRLRTALVGVQVALVMTLLGGASLLARALEVAKNSDPGFRSHDVAVVEPFLDRTGLDDRHSVVPLQAVAERLRALPMVESVAHATVVPFANFFQGTSVDRPGTRERIEIGFNSVSAGLVGTLGLKVIEGRGFTEADEAAEDKLMLTESAARLLWPDESAVGKVIRIGKPMEVVGVLKDLWIRKLGSQTPELYAFQATRGTRFSQLLVRYRGDSSALEAIAKAARLSDQKLRPETKPLGKLVDKARDSARIAANIAWGLSLLSLVLAAVGIYGVAAFNVARRTREIGLRMALGAGASSIVRLVMTQNLMAVGIGAMAGIAGTLGFGVLLRSLLYGIQPHDPAALAMALCILLLSAAVAAWLPSRRAAGVDPAIALRHD